MGLRLALAAATAFAAMAGSATAAEWKRQLVVPGSAFHGVHGIRMGPRGDLLAGSVAGQSLYSVDPKTGQWRVIEGPPQGMADDMAVGPNGQVYWTAISAGIVYTRTAAGVQELARIPSINSIAFSRDGKRLFAAQVFGGDDLYELDPAGKTPPRKIREKMGGFNSFTVGPDGMLYGPLWFKGQVARVNPDTGDLTVVAEGLQTPAAVKMDAAGNLFALDTKTGELLAIDKAKGTRRRVAQLSPALDNFEIVGGVAYVTNMADNGIQEVNLRTGRVRQVIKGALCYPVDIAIGADGGRETIWVADTFAFRSVDPRTGKTTVIDRAYTGNLQNPNGVAVGRTRILLSGGGSVMAYDKATGKFVESWRGLQGGSDPLELADGTIVAAERGRNRIVRLKDGAFVALAEGLQGPASLALGTRGEIYVAEIAGGRVSRIDPATGARTTVAEGLAAPKSVAVGGTGKLYVLEVGAKQVTELDPATGAKTVIASELPVGLIKTPVPSGGGLAVGANGVVYVSSDVENAVYRLTPPK